MQNNFGKIMINQNYLFVFNVELQYLSVSFLNFTLSANP